MKKQLLVLVFVILASNLGLAQGTLAGVNGDCTIGGQQVLTQGLPSTGTQQIGTTNVTPGAGVQASFPLCSVSVYLTGTTNKAAIYSNNLSVPTVLANPFTANADGSFTFFVSPTACYDVTLTTGTGPALPYARTLSDVCFATGGGGGGTTGNFVFESVAFTNLTSVTLATTFTSLPILTQCRDFNNIEIDGAKPYPSTTTPYSMFFNFGSPQSGFCTAFGATSATPPPPPPGVFSCTPALLPFSPPSVLIGTTSSPLTAVCANNTSSTVSGISVAVPAGSNAADFLLTAGRNFCGTVASPISLITGTNCIFQVQFSPTLTSQETASITVTTTSPVGTQTIAMTGTGFTNPPPPAILTIQSGNGAGSGNVNSLTNGVPDGIIACNIVAGSGPSGNCAASYPGGTVVTLSAMPSGGGSFGVWGGITCSNPCLLTLNVSQTISALFNAPAPAAPIALKQQTNLINVGQFPQGQTAGDLNLVVAAWQDNSTTITTLTDTAGNVYTLAATGTKAGTGTSSNFAQATGIPAINNASNTCTTNHTAGDLVIVPLYAPNHAGASYSLANTGGSCGTPYTWKTTSLRQFTGEEDQTIFYSIAPCTGTGDTITATYTGAGFQYPHIGCVEYSGASQSLNSVLDAADNSFKNATTTTATMTTTAITTVGTNDMIFTACADVGTGGSGWAASGSWAFITGERENGFAFNAANQLNIGVSSYTPTMAGSNTNTWQCLAAPFVSASGGSTPGLSESVYISPNIVTSPPLNTVAATWSPSTPPAAELTAYEYSGMQTSAVVDPQLSITAISGSSGTLTFTAANSLVANNQVVLSGFTGGNAGLNGQLVTVSASGLSGTQFEAAVTGSGYSTGTGTGAAVAVLTNTSASPSSGNLVTGYTNDLLFCTNTALASISAVSSGFTTRFIDPLGEHDIEDDYAVGAGTYACAPSLSGSANSITELLALKGASTTPPSGTNYTLQVGCSGTGNGTVTSSVGINATCAAGVVGGAFSASVASGTTVSILATASSPSAFTGYTGSGCDGSPSCSITMSSNRSVTAGFSLGQSYNIHNQPPPQSPFYGSNGNSITTHPLPADWKSHLAGGSTLSNTIAVQTLTGGQGGGVSNAIAVWATPGSDDKFIPLYYAAATDPYFKAGGCSYTAAFPGLSAFRAPNNAPFNSISSNGSQSDGNLRVWDQTSGVVYGSYVSKVVNTGNPPLTIGNSNAQNPSGAPNAGTGSGCGAVANFYNSQDWSPYPGVGSGSWNQNQGAEGSMNLAPFAGIVRSQEMIQGYIGHALLSNFSCDGLDPSGSGLHHVFPALEDTTTCVSTSNMAPNGALIATDYALIPGALATICAAPAIKAWQCTLITAMSVYGSYVSPTSRESGVGINFYGESGFAYWIQNGGTYSENSVGLTVPWTGTGSPYADPVYNFLQNTEGITCGGSSGTSNCKYNLPWFSNIPLINGTDVTHHIFMVDPCIVKGYANQPGGCS